MFKSTKKYSEEELVRGSIRQDRKMQEALYFRFFDSMYRMCYRHCDRDEDLAIDLVNSGFVKVFQKLESFENRGSLEGWIRRCVYHSLCDHFRKTQRDIHFLEMNEPHQGSRESLALQKLYSEDILELIEELPSPVKSVFILFAIEGYSHKEVANALDMSEGTSKWYVNSARKTLKEKLEKLHYPNGMNAKTKI